ncbi:MAG: cytidylate kinase [Candidatus Levybacteria bacterium RIFCSPLOWO2_01_FULL_38_13]|nr:MAG: cytidylate kinase [Candidatus Levybacteria bacterium RIFCSPLOWO2_01_FULL_38_13]
MAKNFSIAIDGPVGVGKGTLAVALAKKFNALYVYTGGMYRALALACLEEGVSLHNEEKVLDALSKSSIELKVDETGTRVYLNGKEVSNEIFLPEVSNAVPIVATFKKIRKKMVLEQKKIVRRSNRTVIEGRDIATDVVPHADLKIYLTADVRVRAERRYKQLTKRGIKTTFEEVLKDTEKRDKMDMEREASPLIVPKDAYVLDTTNLTIDETVDRVMDKLREKGIV